MSDAPRVLTWAAVSSKVQAHDDKFSIPDQIRMNREVVKRLNGVLVDELVVPGFSRNYRTLAHVIAATDDSETDAFRKLHRYIEQRAFDVFVCLDADRFGRKASLVLEVIDTITEDCGADIVTTFDNMTMDDESALTVGLLKAYKAQMDMKRLIAARKKGMARRAAQGKTVSSTVPLFHRRVRGDNGKEIGLEVNEDLRPLWTDLATVLLRRVAWQDVERVLFDEFGHGRVVDGVKQPYPVEAFRSLVLNPGFWGHSGLYYFKKADQSTQFRGPWCWDPAVEPPPPMIIHHHKKPAVYGGPWAELGEQVKRELWRRYRLGGKGMPQNTYRFHGLAVCDECGYTLVKVVNNRRWVYLRCDTRWKPSRRQVTCAQSTHIRAEVVQAYFDDQLRAEVAGLPSDLFDVRADAATLARRIATEERQLKTLKRQLDTATAELVRARKAARDSFQRQIDRLADDIERIEDRLAQWRSDLQTSDRVRRGQEDVIALLKRHGVDWLWEQPDGFIHQVLSTALGDRQIVVRDGEITGTAPIHDKRFKTRRRKSLL